MSSHIILEFHSQKRAFWYLASRHFTFLETDSCFIFIYLFFETDSCCVTKPGVQWHNHSSLQPPTPGLQQSSCLILLSSGDYWCALPHLVNFKFAVETGSCYVAQASLKLLASRDPPASASQSAGITDVSYYAGLKLLLKGRKL